MVKTKKEKIFYLAFFLVWFSLSSLVNASPAKVSELKKQESWSGLAEFLDNFSPRLELKETFNDNIFLTNKDSASDLVTTATVGMQYDEKIWQRKTYLYVDAGTEIKNYSRYDQYNTLNPFGAFFLNYGLGKHRLGAKYSFKRDQRPLSDFRTTNLRDLVNYWVREYSVSFFEDLNRFSLKGEYEHSSESYQEDELEGNNAFEKDTISLIGSLKAFSQTYLFLEYAHDWKEYPKSGKTDRQGNNYWLGLRGKISPKIKGLIKLGYEENEYDDAGDADSNTVQIRLNYAPIRRFNLDLTATREIGESELSSNELDYTQSFALRCNYLPPFNKKLILRSRLLYEFEEYESGREDSEYSLRLTTEYRLKKGLKITGEYTFEKVFTDDDRNEYDNNIFTLKLVAEF